MSLHQHTVDRPGEDAMIEIEHRQRVRRALHAAGLSLPAPDASSPQVPLSQERRDELARLFATGQPLSEVIIEERSDR